MVRLSLSRQRQAAQFGCFFTAAFWMSILLSICHITEANAMPPLDAARGASALPVQRDLVRAASHERCGAKDFACRERAYAAYSDAPLPKGNRDGYVEEPRAPRYAHPACEEFYASREYRSFPTPEPYHYDPYRHGTCGVRCWYKRLTSGYCGRGCEYYLFRTQKDYIDCEPRH